MGSLYTGYSNLQQEQITVIQSNVATATTDITTLKGDVTSINSSISALQSGKVNVSDYTTAKNALHLKDTNFDIRLADIETNTVKTDTYNTTIAIITDKDNSQDASITLLQNNNTFEKQNLPNENKKQLFNHSYISDRIFSLNISTVNSTNNTNNNKLSSNSNNIKIKY